MLWRQGDVYIADVESIPEGARRLPHCVLAEGEATGHCHRIAETDLAELLEADAQRFLRVHGGPVTLTHDEHGPITLPPGTYRVWQQREYAPGGFFRPVMD
jgi:hypothetical protein